MTVSIGIILAFGLALVQGAKNVYLKNRLTKQDH
jgi:hypothetical protein